MCASVCTIIGSFACYQIYRYAFGCVELSHEMKLCSTWYSAKTGHHVKLKDANNNDIIDNVIGVVWNENYLKGYYFDNKRYKDIYFIYEYDTETMFDSENNKADFMEINIKSQLNYFDPISDYNNYTDLL